MMNSTVKLPVLLALTIGCMVVVLAGQAIAPLRAIAACLLILFIPGYSITSAAFPERAWATPERILFTLGASLSLAVLSGLVLNWTRWGLQTASWTLFLGGVSLLAALLGSLRERTEQAQTSFLAGSLRTRNATLLALAGLVTASAYGIAAYGASVQPTTRFTQLWMLPADGTAPSVRVGIRNEERATTDYRLVLRSGVEVVQEWPTITLSTGQEWDTVVAVTSPQGTTDLVASLYRQDQPNAVYRYVTLRFEG